MKDSTSNFDAEKFVDNLINNGARVNCDNTNDKYNEYKLPADFDEEKFKRGQKFYHDNIFMLFMGKLTGLVTILSIPSILKILVFTNMSATTYTSYRRYMATIFHMNVWYTDDFKPGSDLWKSMADVRRKHNTASKRSACVGANRISQLDMAITQFGFMGYALTHPEKIGLFHPDPVGLEGFVYLWRIIGDLMGIEDQFNICRHSAEDTRAVCQLIIEKQLRKYAEQRDPLFVKMASTLVEGMQVMQPFLCPGLTLVVILRLVSPGSQLLKEEMAKLNKDQLWSYNFEQLVINSCRHWFWRWYLNMTLHVSLWLMKYFPFLALWKYGRKDGYVRILEEPAPSLRNVYQSG
ncbi:uncharacterized protein [Atheta coriaria]|uniref:uncharacterized protein n=1 Tax=Dalotia coriaria TaxID=877792 RepID=UPI0031F40A55